MAHDVTQFELEAILQHAMPPILDRLRRVISEPEAAALATLLDSHLERAAFLASTAVRDEPPRPPGSPGS